MTSTIKTQPASIATAQAGVDTIAKASLGIMGATSALIGLWSVGCLVSAMVGSGPLAMLGGLASAVIG